MPRTSRPIANALKAAAVTLLLLNFLFAQVHFERSGHRLPSEWFSELDLRGSEELQTLFLNYQTFAADLGWIALVINYGEGRQARSRFGNLLHNASVVRDLDDQFYRLYDWFPAVYLVQVYPVPFERAEEAADFVQRGIEQFPNDGKLAFHASVSFIGIQNPQGEGPQRRYRKIVDLAELSALRGDPDAAGVIPFYRARLSGEAKTDSAAEANFLISLFARAQSDRERQQIKQRLAQLEKDPEVATKLLRRVDDFNNRRQRVAAYLTPEMFALVQP